jgi:hypothetical protein
MDGINAIILRGPSAHETNTSSAMREAMVTSSALKPQGSLADELDKSLVRAS